MNNFVEKISVEGFKPATGFINAILGPKIEKVREWAMEKELSGAVKPDSLARTISDYLTNLAHRVSEITSIAFPQRKLNIFDAYEPLELEYIHKTYEDESFDFDGAVTDPKNSYVIIDGAGMGKSTYVKHMVGQLLLKSDRIPILLELRKLEKGIDITESLVRELDFPGEPFSRELFFRLLKNGKFFVILDGFDEIDLEYQEVVANQISELSVKRCDNAIILTSRPQDKLPDLMRGRAVRFKPFTLAQSISLARRYDKIANLDIGERLMGQLSQVPSRFIETPLHVVLLYQTFGVNNSIASRVSTFYDEMFNALYKGHDLVNKSGFTREKKSKLDYEDFKRLLRNLCYLMTINRKTSFDNVSQAISYVEKASSLTTISPATAENYLDDLLVSVPLMVKEGSEVKFLHKTIIEYFAADYLNSYKNSAALVNKMFSSKMAPSFAKVFEFLSDINPSIFHGVITKSLAKEVIDLKCDGGEGYRALKTLNFISKYKIALWEMSYLLEKVDGKKENIPPMELHRSAFEGEAFESSWRPVRSNGVECYLAIAVKNNNKVIYEPSWIAVTQEVTKLSQFGGMVDCSALEDVVGLNRWKLISDDMIEKVSEIECLTAFVIGQIRGLGNVETSFPRLLSSELAQMVVNDIESEENMETEIESMFND